VDELADASARRPELPVEQREPSTVKLGHGPGLTSTWVKSAQTAST
jgi:hypothetical protein